MNFDLKQLTWSKVSKNTSETFMHLVARHNASPEGKESKELKVTNDKISKYE